MTERPIVIDRSRTGEVATRWTNTAGIGERPRLVAVEWKPKERKTKAKVDAEPRVSRGIVQGSLL